MHRVHKVALDLNDLQSTYMAKAAGVARVAYNWALSWWGDAYRQWLVDPTSCERPNESRARLHLNMAKGEAFPWMAEVTKCAPQEAVRDLGRAFANFFAGRAAYPKRHKKGVHDSFRISSGFFKVDGARLWVPNLGWVRMTEHLRWPDARLLSVTISKHRGRWFASIAADLPDPQPAPTPVSKDTAIGIDVGTHGYVTSNGQIVATPRSYARAQGQLRRAQKKLARQKKGSSNGRKTKAKIARLHGRVADIRSNWLHQLTAKLTTENTLIGIEDLNVAGMTARAVPKPDPNRPGSYLPNKARAKSGLNKSILDAGFAEFRRQLEYKCPERGVTLVVADKWFPSSKTCNVCGVKTKHLSSLHIRRWICENCGTPHHRDINAAINLKNHAVSSTVSACGEFYATDPPGQPDESSNLDEAGTRHQLVNDHV